MRIALLGLGLGLALVGCGGPARATPAAFDAPDVAIRARPRDLSYALSWNGAPLGWAREHDDGRRWQRREQVVVRRGDQVVVSELELTIDRDEAGVARSVQLARWQDGPVLRGRATAVDGGWLIDIDGESPLTVGEATPFELAITRAAGFHGPVLLAGYGFAIADLSLPAARASTATATLTIAGRSLIATIRYRADGTIREIRGADGVIAREVDSWTLARPSTPLEVVGGNAIPVEGSAGGGSVWLPDATGPLPPALPGQRITVSPDRPGWLVHFDATSVADLPPGPPGPDQTSLLQALARQVSDDVEDDLGATALTQATARTALRGDCTTHALRFAALASDLGLQIRIVTGLRLDNGALVRHRWVLAWTGTHWLPIDPTYAEAPASPVLLGLALHGPRAADLALADATVFDPLGRRALAVP